MHALPWSIRIVLATIVLTAAIFDYRQRRIPNWLNLSGLILGFGLNVLFYQTHGALTAGEGLLFASAVYLPLYLLRGMGAGDVKLMAAVGALVGPANWFQIFVATALIGGGVAAGMAFLKKRFTETFCNVTFLVKDLVHVRAPYRTSPQLDFRTATYFGMPHGVLIAIGSLFVLLIPALSIFGW